MRLKTLLWWGLLLLWCGLIFWGTGDPRFTGESTQSVVARALPSSTVASASQLDWVNMTLRKSTHVVLFSVLGMLGRKAIRSWPGGAPSRAAGWAWLFTTGYAASDEWHQHFIPRRTASGWDVLLDSVAAALVLLIRPYTAHYLGARKAEPRL